MNALGYESLAEKLLRLGSLRAGEYRLRLSSGFPVLEIGYREPVIAAAGRHALQIAEHIEPAERWHDTIPLRQITNDFASTYEEETEQPSYFDTISYLEDVASSFDSLDGFFTDEEPDMDEYFASLEDS